jgi:hypothetical protein
MRSRIFRLAGGLLGVAAVVVGVTILIAGNAASTSNVLGAIAIVGMGVYFVRYAITGKPTLFAHRFKVK